MELALPSGSLESAYAAFKGGADAIYLGLNRFSARSRATNFTYEDLEKILSYTKANNKKVYVVLNTLVEDENINEVYKTLKRLSLYPIDAIIVQDLGIVNLVKDYFPTIELHGSTQLAVHTIEGVRYMKNLGFTRVVLSRELSLNQIREIKENCPDIEIKVFVHGAMCYGFSGLCSASVQLTNRSANQGECTQICRRFFENKNHDTMFPFSMKDLDGTEAVLELQEMGIDSLKIEGRMKSPNYCFKTARHYRYLLDNKKINSEYYLEMLTSFSRSNKSGYLKGKSDLIDYNYSEHNGILLSNRLTKERKEITFTLNHAVSNYDGLLILEKIPNQVDRVIKLSLQNFKIRNKKVVKAYKGDTISIFVKDYIGDIRNCSIYKISDSQSNAKYTSEKFTPIKYLIPTTLDCEENALTLKANAFNQELKLRKILSSEVANNSEAVSSRLQSIFDTSSTLLLTNIEVKSKYAYPLKEVKALKREWYEIVNNAMESWIDENYKSKDFEKMESESLPTRSLLFNQKNHPWTNTNDYITIEDKCYIILRPIILNEKDELEKLSNIYNQLISKGKTVYIGLNNIAHINWVKTLVKAKVFVDWYLFATNSESSKLFAKTIPNFIGGYTYYEFSGHDSSKWCYNTTDVDSKAKMPYFISLACYRRNVLGKSCNGCNKDFEYFITQNDRKYRISCDNCISVTQSF